MFGLMKLKDAAQELNVPVSTLNTWRFRQDIPKECFKKIGSSVFIKIDVFKKWIEAV